MNSPTNILIFFIVIYSFCSYIRVYFQLVVFVREHILDKVCERGTQ